MSHDIGACINDNLNSMNDTRTKPLPYFLSGATVIPFESVRATCDSEKRDNDYEAGITIIFKNGEYMGLNGSSAEIQRFIDDFTTYLWERGKRDAT
jgi:hypothetical protein